MDDHVKTTEYAELLAELESVEPTYDPTSITAAAAIRSLMAERDEAHAAFLEEAARYFESRDTHGEDRAYWANVYNAENCRKSAAAIRSLMAERDEALQQYIDANEARIDAEARLAEYERFNGDAKKVADGLLASNERAPPFGSYAEGRKWMVILLATALTSFGAQCAREENEACADIAGTHGEEWIAEKIRSRMEGKQS